METAKGSRSVKKKVQTVITPIVPASVVKTKRPCVQAHRDADEERRSIANQLLDDPNIPIWRISEMYQGIQTDRNYLTTDELALKYGMPQTSIKRIIKNNCYQ